MSYNNHLAVSWSTSKGQDTYGYNICRLDSYASGKRYRTCGGGYDMLGTVFGHWLEAEHQGKLRELVAGLALVDCGYAVAGYKKPADGFYGLTVRPDGSISLDGACGLSSMQAIGNAIGLTFKWLGNRKGHTTGYVVSEAVEVAL